MIGFIVAICLAVICVVLAIKLNHKQKIDKTEKENFESELQSLKIDVNNFLIKKETLDKELIKS